MKTATLKKPARRTVTLLNAGAKRGARLNVDALLDWNQRSESVSLVPRYVDPVPGRALALVKEAADRGLQAEAVEGTIEETMKQGVAEGTPILLNLDQPRAIAETILAAENAGTPLLGYLLVKLPSGALWGVRFFIRANDPEARRQGVIFFHRLAELTARRGSAAIIGDGGDIAHRANEAKYRAWFSRHTTENLAKLVAGVEPSGNTFEVTDDGVATYALLIQTAETWSDPRSLAEAVANDPPVAILRGESFVVGEITPEGVRFHKVARRKTDDRVALQGLGVIDNAGVDTERASREAAAALLKAERETVSRRNPVMTTD